jgi:chemotaxis protein CheC
MTLPPDKDLLSDDFYADYNPKFEALQEISNIGVGHAATALSQLLNRKVDMSIPRINLVEFDEAPKHLASSPEDIVSGILMTTSETNTENNLNLLLIFDKNSVLTLLSILRTSQPVDDLANLDEISTSILKETGNILLLHTISAINSFTDSRWFPAAPELVIDMVKALTEELLLTASENDKSIEPNKVLLVECDVFTDDGQKVKGDVLLFPNSNAMDILMKRLYGENWEEMM